MKNIFVSVISVCVFSAPVFATEPMLGDDSVITGSSSTTSSSSNSSRESIETLLKGLAEDGESISFTDTYLSQSQPLPNSDRLMESVTDVMTEDLTLSRKALTIAPKTSTFSASIAAAAASSTQVTIKRGTSLNLPEPDNSSDDTDSSSDDSSSSSDDDAQQQPRFNSASAAAASAYDPSDLTLSLPSRLIFTIVCQTFNFTKPDIIPANSLDSAFQTISAAPVQNTTNGIKALILDVDGTLTTHPERDPSKYLWPLAQREQCVNSIRTIKTQPRIEVFFSSAWRSRDTTDSESIRSTLSLLREVGFTNADLGIKDDDKVIELHIRVCLGTHKRGKKPKTFLIKAFKCGNVVSSTTPNNTDYFFRGKLFAPAIAQPLICSSIEVVGLVDDSRKNAQVFVEDTMFNPYGSNAVTYLPILLSAYRPTDSDDEE